MPPLLTPQYSSTNLKSIHLLRALLREASYLPDKNSRGFFRKYIVDRFKAYQPKENGSPRIYAREAYRRAGFKRRDIAIINYRVRPMQRKATKGLNYLRRANVGERRCLEKIMLFTYGRMGRRKYYLQEQLLRVEGHLYTPDTPAPLQALYYSNKRFLEYFDPPKKISDREVTFEISDRYPRLKEVIKSQTQNSVAIHGDLKTNRFKMPIYNIWERPMPIKRARNAVKRWYGNTMSKLLPPLPSDEWDHLRALSTGETKWIDFVAQRTPGTVLKPEPADEIALARAAIEQGLAFDKLSKADKHVGEPCAHKFTPRTMRRLYAKVFALCCKLEFDAERDRWTVHWGSLKDVLPRAYSTPVDDALFAGVDGKGKLYRNTGASKKLASS